MKTVGIVILVIGVLITVYTGFNFVTKEKVVDVGPVEITRDKNNWVQWSPLLGVVVIAAGGCMWLYGMKRS